MTVKEITKQRLVSSTEGCGLITNDERHDMAVSRANVTGNLTRGLDILPCCFFPLNPSTLSEAVLNGVARLATAKTMCIL